MQNEKLFETIEELKGKYLKVWEDVCSIESPTSFKEGVDRVGEYCIKLAENLGFDVEIHEEKISGNAVCITMNKDSKERGVALSGHMDTVHPIGLFTEPVVKIEGERIYGPGVTDCKGGIVSAFLAMEALQKCGYEARPIYLLLQSDEENSSITSNKETVRFMAEKAKDCVAFLNGEGYTKGKIVTTRKGIIRYVLEIEGKAAHSSKCYNGVSAITEAAHKIIELEKWKEEDGITCNCGVINGGTVANSVAQTCTFLADIRYQTKEELEIVKKRVQEIADKSYIGGTTCKLSVKSQRVCMEKCDRNIELFKKVSEIFKENGFEEIEMMNGNGGSDAADMTNYGIPCLDSFGVEGGGIHSKNEYGEIASLASSAKKLAAVIVRL